MKSLPRIFDRLLRLYPAAHRREYGEEMLEAARHRWERAGGSNSATAAALGDLVFGAVGVWKDHLGRQTMGMGKGWGLDARFVSRSLWGAPGYVTTAVLVLACAVAVNASVYSYARGTLLSEPSYPDPGSVVLVWGSNVTEGQRRDVISGPNFMDIHQEVTALESVAAFHGDGTYLLVDGHPEVIQTFDVSVDFFRVLRVEPALGRFFDESDRTSSAPATIVATYGFWRDRLASDPSAVGRPLDLEGEPHILLGVLPEDFEFVAPLPLYRPLRDDVLAADNRARIHYNVVGRLAEGASVSDANVELGRIGDGILADYAGFEGWSLLAESLREVSVEAVRPVIWILVVTVALVLLVALVNLATLFRIRSVSRQDEFAVRMALGATWLRITRILALETVVIASFGAALGLAAAPFLLRRLAAMLPLWIQIPDSAARVPVLRAVLDPSVALIAFGGAVLGALILTGPTFVSAVRATGAARAGRVVGATRGIRVLVAVELAVATVLCIGAALTARSASNLLSTDVGLVDEGLLTLGFGDVWDLDAPGQIAYFRAAVEAVEAIPGVRRAGVTDYVDFKAEDDFARVYFLDRSFQPMSDTREEWRRVDEGLFEAAGMTMGEGRSFEPDDFTGDPRVAIVSATFAAKHYADRSPLGQFISTHETNYRDLEIVGVVRDVRSLGPATSPPPMLYVPNQGSPRGVQGMYVRVAGDPMTYATLVRDAIWSVDSSRPVMDIEPMATLVNNWVAIPKATRALVLGLALLAWMLSAVGVFGVVAYAVKVRKSELGIRLALGASPDRLERDQLRDISPVVVLGIGAGLMLGLLAARAAGAVLYGVSPFDPISLTAAVGVMAAAAFVATYLPARRAARIDPSEVMRPE